VPIQPSHDWLRQYEQMVLDPEGDFQAIVDFKREHLPKSLFRYRVATDDNLDSLVREYVWMSAPASFNDLYDSRTHVDAKRSFNLIGRDGLRQFLEEHGGGRLVAEQIETIVHAESPLLELRDTLCPDDGSPEAAEKRRVIEGATNAIVATISHFLSEGTSATFQNALKVCCFSETGCSPTMWAHYAKDHSGFCVEYAPEDIPADDIRVRLLLPVMYVDSAPLDGTEMAEAGLAGPSSFALMWPLLAATYKDRAWSDEREWRIVNPDGRTEGFAMLMPKPRAVYLGARMSVEDERKITLIAKAKGIPIFKMRSGGLASQLEAERVLEKSELHNAATSTQNLVVE
jgi:hypothetical protein